LKLMVLNKARGGTTGTYGEGYGYDYGYGYGYGYGADAEGERLPPISTKHKPAP
jgi:hypothetical protein